MYKFNRTTGLSSINGIYHDWQKLSFDQMQYLEIKTVKYCNKIAISVGDTYFVHMNYSPVVLYIHTNDTKL